MTTDNTTPSHTPDTHRAWAEQHPADAQDFIRGFYDALSERLLTESVPSRTAATLLARVHSEATALLDDDVRDLPDRAADINRRITFAVLAAHRVLVEAKLPAFGAENLVTLLDEVVVAAAGPWPARGTAAALDAAPDPLALLASISRAKEAEAFGAEFEFAHPRDDGDAYFADVHRCGYHDLLTRLDAAALPPALCAFDTTWLSAVDPARHGLRATRVTSIGLGGPICPFHFERVPRSAADERTEGGREG